jgi:hypothetical protein
MVADRTPTWRGVVIDRLTATGAQSVGIVIGLPEAPIPVRMRHIHVSAPQGLLVRNATVTATDLHAPPPRLERQGRLVRKP